MTDKKRDESRDVGVRVSRRPDDNIEMDCEPWKRVNPLTYGVSHYDRFVPHSDLVAAEAKTEKLREALDMLLDEINASPLAVHGGKRDIDRFELALKVAREFANEGRP